MYPEPLASFMEGSNIPVFIYSSPPPPPSYLTLHDSNELDG